MQTSDAFFSIASVAAVNAVLWKLGGGIEQVASSDARKAASTWLKNVDLQECKLKTWASTFVSVFDAVFGKRHISWKCYFRSIIATILIATIVLLNFGFILGDGSIPWDRLAEAKGVVLILAFVNVHADYISLLETRYLLNWMGKRSSPYRNLFILVLDFVATSLIFAIMVIPSGFLIEYINRNVIELTSTGVGVVADDLILIFFISTFATSIWLWLYSISGFAIKSMTTLNPLLGKARNFLDVEDKPFLSISVISMVITTSIILLGFILAKSF